MVNRNGHSNSADPPIHPSAHACVGSERGGRELVKRYNQFDDRLLFLRLRSKNFSFIIIILGLVVSHERSIIEKKKREEKDSRKFEKK